MMMMMTTDDKFEELCEAWDLKKSSHSDPSLLSMLIPAAVLFAFALGWFLAVLSHLY